VTICPGEVATKKQLDVDPQYYEANKHKMSQKQSLKKLHIA